MGLIDPTRLNAGYGMNAMCPPGVVISAYNSGMAKWLSDRRLEDIKTNPSDSIYVADSSSGLYPGAGYHLNVIWKTPWGGDGSWLSAPARRHPGGDQGSFNTLFFDFHVENGKWPYEDHGPHRLWNIWQYRSGPSGDAFYLDN
jgi:prepilin-type processing-associated H-X9-DG protein